MLMKLPLRDTEKAEAAMGESTERTTVDIVPPALVSSVPALPQSATAASPVGFDVESNDEMYEEFFGSRSTTSSEGPTGNAMPRWRRGVLRAVALVSGCDGEDVGAGTIDDDEASMRSEGRGGGGDGGAGDDDGGSVREELGDDVRDDDVADAHPVEEVRAHQPSSPITNAHLREPPMLSICEILGYDLREPTHVEVDLTMCVD